jgi:hypothetical protein
MRAVADHDGLDPPRSGELLHFWIKRCEKWAAAIAAHGGGHTIHTTRWTESNETFHKACGDDGAELYIFKRDDKTKVEEHLAASKRGDARAKALIQAVGFYLMEPRRKNSTCLNCSTNFRKGADIPKAFAVLLSAKDPYAGAMVFGVCARCSAHDEKALMVMATRRLGEMLGMYSPTQPEQHG